MASTSEIAPTLEEGYFVEYGGQFEAQQQANLRLLVHVNTKLNTGHANALAAESIILPSLARDEEPHRSAAVVRRHDPRVDLLHLPALEHEPVHPDGDRQQHRDGRDGVLPA